MSATQKDIDQFNSLVASGKTSEAYKLASSLGYGDSDIASYVSTQYNVPIAEATAAVQQAAAAATSSAPAPSAAATAAGSLPSGGPLTQQQLYDYATRAGATVNADGTATLNGKPVDIGKAAWLGMFPEGSSVPQSTIDQLLQYGTFWNNRPNGEDSTIGQTGYLNILNPYDPTGKGAVELRYTPYYGAEGLNVTRDPMTGAFSYTINGQTAKLVEPSALERQAGVKPYYTIEQPTGDALRVESTGLQNMVSPEYSADVRQYLQDLNKPGFLDMIGPMVPLIMAGVMNPGLLTGAGAGAGAGASSEGGAMLGGGLTGGTSGATGLTLGGTTSGLSTAGLSLFTPAELTAAFPGAFPTLASASTFLSSITGTNSQLFSAAELAKTFPGAFANEAAASEWLGSLNTVGGAATLPGYVPFGGGATPVGGGTPGGGSPAAVGGGASSGGGTAPAGGGIPTGGGVPTGGGTGGGTIMIPGIGGVSADKLLGLLGGAAGLFGSKTDNQTVSKEPWSAAVPYLTAAMQRANQLGAEGSPYTSPEQMVAPLTQTQNAANAAGLQAADSLSSYAKELAAALMPWATGQHLNITNDTIAQDAIAAALDPMARQYKETVMPAIQRSSIATGGLGGSRQGVAEGLAADRYMQDVGNTSATMAKSVYDRNLSQMIAAGNLIPQFDSMLMAPYTVGQAVGTQQQQQEQALRDAIGKLFQTKLATQTTTGSLLAQLSGQGGQVVTDFPDANPLTSAIGGALSGYALGNKLFSNPSSTTTSSNNNFSSWFS